jgi:hypothetical protein
VILFCLPQDVCSNLKMLVGQSAFEPRGFLVSTWPILQLLMRPEQYPADFSGVECISMPVRLDTALGTTEAQTGGGLQAFVAVSPTAERESRVGDIKQRGEIHVEKVGSGNPYEVRGGSRRLSGSSLDCLGIVFSPWSLSAFCISFAFIGISQNDFGEQARCPDDQRDVFVCPCMIAHLIGSVGNCTS